jgi:hypothetical protein
MPAPKIKTAARDWLVSPPLTVKRVAYVIACATKNFPSEIATADNSVSPIPSKINSSIAWDTVAQTRIFSVHEKYSNKTRINPIRLGIANLDQTLAHKMRL